MKKKKSLKQLERELKEYNVGAETSKYIAFEMSLKFKSSKVPNKKKYSKKDRRQNKIKNYEL